METICIGSTWKASAVGTQGAYMSDVKDGTVTLTRDITRLQMPGSPKSDYEVDDYSEFSEKDFAQIDALTSVYFNAPLPNGGPQVRVELETQGQKYHEIKPSGPAENPDPVRSPIEVYRRSGILSVTDLVSPIWCEVQFDYGLRQRRSKPLELRPTSFVSASGKEISVEKKVAAQNDVVTKQGKAVHKKLEDELGLKQIMVDVTSQEERWGLRMLNLITGIQAILLYGFTRELPVFGIIHDQIVIGVIDEVTRCIHPKSKRDPQPDDDPERGKTSKGQTCIEDFFGKDKACRRHTHTLMITDTKTRRSDSLPSPEDALPSRLQLMLYHQLLSTLLSEYPPFEFSSLWDRLGLDSSAGFSPGFLVGAGLILDRQEEQFFCLDDLVNYWHRTVQELDIVGVDAELRLIYRLRPDPRTSESQSNRKPTGQPRAETTLLVSQEDHDLALAIEASLQDLERGEELGRIENIIGSDGSSAHDSVDPECSSQQSISNDRPGSTEKNANANIIGTKSFFYDETFLDGQIAEILEWWYGKRKPKGVPVHLARRCFTCEYHADCEWREEKALYFSKSIGVSKNVPAS